MSLDFDNAKTYIHVRRGEENPNRGEFKMKKKTLLWVFAAASAVTVTGCCCCGNSKPCCVEEEEAIIITPAQTPAPKKCSKHPKTACNSCGCEQKNDKKQDNHSDTVAVNIAGCGSENGKCPAPAPAPAPAHEN